MRGSASVHPLWVSVHSLSFYFLTFVLNQRNTVKEASAQSSEMGRDVWTAQLTEDRSQEKEEHCTDTTQADRKYHPKEHPQKNIPGVNKS